MTARVLDLVIVGGGPAGLAAAIRARQRGQSVRVLAKPRGAGLRLGESLAPGAAPILRELGCGDDLARDGHLPCPGNASSWASPRLEFHSFTADPRGCAWLIDRARFEARLRARAVALGAQFVELRASPTIERRADGFRVDGILDARALIDATGRGSAVARALGARRVAADRQVAVVGRMRHVDGEVQRDRSSLVEAVADGWWYAALTPDASLAVLLFTLRATGLELVEPRRFAELLARSEHTAARARGYALDDRPRLVEASTEHLEPVAGAGWRAVGDAALTYDPLASHGLTFALASGRDAVDSLAADDVEGYVARIGRARATYASMRRRIYAAQPRFRAAPYWRARP